MTTSCVPLKSNCYHADSHGTCELFSAVGNFASAFAAAEPMGFFDDRTWRKSIDKDFKNRK